MSWSWSRRPKRRWRCHEPAMPARPVMPMRQHHGRANKVCCEAQGAWCAYIVHASEIGGGEAFCQSLSTLGRGGAIYDGVLVPQRYNMAVLTSDEHVKVSDSNLSCHISASLEHTPDQTQGRLSFPASVPGSVCRKKSNRRRRWRGAVKYGNFRIHNATVHGQHALARC